MWLAPTAVSRAWWLVSGEYIGAGRNVGAIVVGHKSVSREHARLIVAPSEAASAHAAAIAGGASRAPPDGPPLRLTVEDLDSKFGVYVNDQATDGVTELVEGDTRCASGAAHVRAADVRRAPPRARRARRARPRRRARARPRASTARARRDAVPRVRARRRRRRARGERDAPAHRAGARSRAPRARCTRSRSAPRPRARRGCARSPSARARARAARARRRAARAAARGRARARDFDANAASRARRGLRVHLPPHRLGALLAHLARATRGARARARRHGRRARGRGADRRRRAIPRRARARARAVRAAPARGRRARCRASCPSRSRTRATCSSTRSATPSARGGSTRSRAASAGDARRVLVAAARARSSCASARRRAAPMLRPAHGPVEHDLDAARPARSDRLPAVLDPTPSLGRDARLGGADARPAAPPRGRAEPSAPIARARGYNRGLGAATRGFADVARATRRTPADAARTLRSRARRPRRARPRAPAPAAPAAPAPPARWPRSRSCSPSGVGALRGREGRREPLVRAARPLGARCRAGSRSTRASRRSTRRAPAAATRDRGALRARARELRRATASSRARALVGVVRDVGAAPAGDARVRSLVGDRGLAVLDRRHAALARARGARARERPDRAVAAGRARVRALDQNVGRPRRPSPGRPSRSRPTAHHRRCSRPLRPRPPGRAQTGRDQTGRARPAAEEPLDDDDDDFMEDADPRERERPRRRRRRRARENPRLPSGAAAAAAAPRARAGAADARAKTRDAARPYKPAGGARRELAQPAAAARREAAIRAARSRWPARGRSFAIVGRLPTLTRARCEALVREYGGAVAGSVSTARSTSSAATSSTTGGPLAEGARVAVPRRACDVARDHRRGGVPRDRTASAPAAARAGPPPSPPPRARRARRRRLARAAAARRRRRLCARRLDHAFEPGGRVPRARRGAGRAAGARALAEPVSRASSPREQRDQRARVARWFEEGLSHVVVGAADRPRRDVELLLRDAVAECANARPTAARGCARARCRGWCSRAARKLNIARVGKLPDRGATPSLPPRPHAAQPAGGRPRPQARARGRAPHGVGGRGRCSSCCRASPRAVTKTVREADARSPTCSSPPQSRSRRRAASVSMMCRSAASLRHAVERARLAAILGRRAAADRRLARRAPPLRSGSK